MTSVAPSHIERRPKPAFLIIPLIALLTLFSWSFASPVGSTPDEAFHLQSIWCAGGTPTPSCGDGPTPDTRSVADDLVDGSVCYANEPTRTPACQGEDFGDDLTQELETSSVGNFTGLYPPVFYFTMNLFTSDNLQLSVLAMRAFNSALFIGMVTLLFFLLPVQRRPTLLISFAATLVPLGIFLIASVNPSGWAIMSAGMLWIALLGFFETTGRRRVALGVFATVATVMGAGARADGAVYSVLAVAAVLVLQAERSRRFLLLAIVPVALSIVAALFFLSAGQSNAASTGLSLIRGGYSKYVLIVENFLNLPSLFVGVFGSWPLGWFDTPLPAIVPFAGTMTLGGLVLLGVGTSYARKTVAVLGGVVVLFLFPLVLLYQSDSRVGDQVQPRYILPILVILLGVILLQRNGGALRVNWVQALLFASALSISNAAALHANIRRYVRGVGIGGGNLDVGVEWWWDAGPSPMTVWVVGSLSFALVLLWLGFLWVRYSQANASNDLVTKSTIPVGHGRTRTS